MSKTKQITLNDLQSKENLQLMVGFDKERYYGFKLYILNGEHTRLANRAMRRAFRSETGCNYFDTRVIPYSTFHKRDRMQADKLDLSKIVKVFNSSDYTKTPTQLKKEERLAEERENLKTTHQLF